MKKIITLCFLLLIQQQMFAQNVGIGTTVPQNSAILDINSDNKGVLFPRIYLQSSFDNSSISNPATGLMVYNTNHNLTGGTGLFYNNGTPASVNWAKVGDLKFPYNSGASAANTSCFYIQNYAAGAGSNGIRGYSEHGSGLYGSSNDGTGVYASSFSGNALEVSGLLKISGTGQSPSQGKVLTSDANGNATWQGAIAFCSAGIQPGGAAEFSDAVEKRVPFYTTEHNYGSAYTNSSQAPYSTFTAPVKGIYHFDVKTVWAGWSTGSYSSLSLKTTYNNSTKEVTADKFEFNGQRFQQNNISIDVLLEQGTQVYATLTQTSADVLGLANYSVFGKVGYFSGRLVMRL